MHVPRPLIAALLLSAFAVSSALSAGAAEVLMGSGRYEEQAAGVVAWRPKAIANTAKVEAVVLQDGLAKAGATVATLKVDGLDDLLAEARRAQADAKRAAAYAKEDVRVQEEESAAALLRARSDLDTTLEKRKHWLSSERADALLDSTQRVDNAQAKVKEATEELRQLEHMYKEARIDGSTQDLVINRERRKLKMDEMDLAQATRRHEHYVAVELPQADAAWMRAENEATLRHQAEVRRTEREKARVQSALDAALRALKSANSRLADLEADAAALTIAVPVDGRVEGLALKAGMEVKPGQEVAKVAAPMGGQVRIEVPPEMLAKLAVGKLVHLRLPEIGAAVDATVAEMAWAGRPEGARTLFAVVCKPTLATFSARPGLKVDVFADDGGRP